MATTTGTASLDSTDQLSWAERLGTIGWFAKGVIYLLLAVIVAQLAFSGNTGDETATKEGALERLSDQPFGAALLTAVMIGLACYAAYRTLSVFLPTTGNDEKDKAKHLLRVGSAIVYGALALQACSVLTSGQRSQASTGEAEVSRSWSAALLSSTAGKAVLVVIGLGLLGVAVYQVRKGVTHGFMERISCSGAWPSNSAVERAGTAGHVARGVVVALIGVFVLGAVLHHDPNEVRGLDGTLRGVADAPAGSVVLAAVAGGLAAYGLYALMASRCRRHSEG